MSSEVSSEDLEEYMDSVFQVVSRGKDDILELTIYDDTLTESMSDLSNSNIGKDDDEELFHPHEKDKVSIGIRRSRKTLSEVSSDLLLSKHSDVLLLPFRRTKSCQAFSTWNWKFTEDFYQDFRSPYYTYLSDEDAVFQSIALEGILSIVEMVLVVKVSGFISSTRCSFIFLLFHKSLKTS